MGGTTLMWLRRECWEMTPAAAGSLTASLVGNVAHGAFDVEREWFICL